jgi:glutamate-ammonia-ligase adenylyltransferase
VRALVEKFLHVISGYTRDGTLFPVDTRLRPRGSEGELVQTAEGMLDYFRTAAEVWEGVTYLKARPLGGDWKLGRDWCEELSSLLGERFSEWEAVRSALRQMRQRLEGEGGTAGAEDNFKTGVGGIYDLDFILSGLALRSRALPPAGQGFSKQIAALCRAGELSPQDGQELRQAAHLLQAVDHAIRLVSGHSTPTLSSGPRAEVVAELAGRWVGEALNAESLKSRVSETRRNLRAHFLRVFG